MLSDLRFALRTLWKSPGFTAVAVLTLTLGIGATTTVFCWMQSILLHPLRGVARPQEVIVLTTQHGTTMWDGVSPPDIRDLSELKDVFAGISQRTQEFGVRMALGANQRALLAMVLREGLTLAAAGIAAGLVLAASGANLLASFLYDVSPFDPLTFTGVPVLLAAMTLLACWVPARRATRVDPMFALRSE